METSLTLSAAELDRLDRLEDEQARGEAVRWDEPKTVRGIVVRDVETVTFKDKNTDESKTKHVLTMRTETGLAAIFEGPTALNSRLFAGERACEPDLGPPRTGDLVIVTYKGEKTSEAGFAYKAFDVSRSAVKSDEQPPPISDDEADAIAAEQARREIEDEDVRARMEAESDDIPF